MKGLGQRARTAEEDVQTLRKYVEQLPQVSILDGQEVEGVIFTGATFAVIRHSLGRAYRGGLIVGQSHGFPGCVVQTPQAAGATADPAAFVIVRTTAAASTDVVVRAWVY